MVPVNGTELHVQDVGPRDAPALLFHEVARSEAIAVAAPAGRCVVVQGVGRSVALEAADEVDRQIAEHLARVAAGLHART